MMDKRIESEGPEMDSYWINLKPGYCVSEGIAVLHSITEETHNKAHAKMSQVRHCICASCRAELAA